MTIVQEDKGEDWYFVAKKRNKILWKYDAWGKVLHDDYSGMYVLESVNLLVVDRFGKVRKQLWNGAAQNPRSIFLQNGNLVYDTGNLATGVRVRQEWAMTAAWLREARRVCAYDVRNLRFLWSAAESDVGIPISCNNQYLDTMVIINLVRCLKTPNKTPIVAIDEINIKTGSHIRRAILSTTRSEALSLKDCFLDSVRNPPSHVIWTATGVHIYGLFERNYIGKIKGDDLK